MSATSRGSMLGTRSSSNKAANTLSLTKLQVATVAVMRATRALKFLKPDNERLAAMVRHCLRWPYGALYPTFPTSFARPAQHLHRTVCPNPCPRSASAPYRHACAIRKETQMRLPTLARESQSAKLRFLKTFQPSDLLNLIKYPLFSEKSMKLIQNGRYTFIVDRS
jgi:hypothetical protein